MTELNCEIIEKTLRGENEYYLVNCIGDNQNYFIPIQQLLKHKVEVGKSYYFEKKLNTKSQKYFLEYLYQSNKKVEHHYYKINECYEFKIVDIESTLNKKGNPISIISIEDIDGNIITVLGLKWQTKELWKFETLNCEIERIMENGFPILINKDYRHPIYQIGKEYDFKIIGDKTKSINNIEYNIFELEGDDNCIHEVNKFPGQKFNQIDYETIKCVVINITTHIRLSQGNVKDKYFSSFEKIVNDISLERKYFKTLFNNSDRSNKDENQLIEQYNSRSAFWVFTFANKILPKLFRENIQKQDFKKSKEINQLIIAFEDWIITKGIITSFPDEEIRESTIIKAKSQLESAKILDSVISILISNPFYFLTDDVFFNDKKNLIARLYYITSFSNIEVVDANLFINRLIKIIQEIKLELITDTQYLNNLLYYISHNKKTFISETEKEYFSLSSQKTEIVLFTENEKKYINWSYSEILIAQVLSKKEHVNILIGQLLKLYTKSIADINVKECLLFNAYKYFENFQNLDINIPFEYNEQLSINFNLLNTLFSNDNFDNDIWDSLENSQKKEESFSVQLTQKSKTGYEVSYENLKGFLPYHLIKESKLKKFPFEECNFTINAKCISISRHFNFFIIEQSLDENSDESCINNILFIEGKTYDAIIKNVVGYGLFLSTNAGEGLLHVNDIFDFQWNNGNIYNYFKVGQKIKVILLEISQEDKAQFNFYKIKENDLFYYNDYVERVLSKNSASLFEPLLEKEHDTSFDIALNEKAFCIEQFAVLQVDFDKKIQNFQIAKQFYTNAKNARSFLINIYTSYFEILLNIKLTLQSGSLKDIISIKDNAKEIKNKMNQKTIETFPDSDKLIFFLDIISIFNEKSETTLELLFDYIKKYTADSSHKELKTIAKITLANNLLISESKEDTDFSIKNLRMIFDYLSNGILSLEETIEDINSRQLKEDILFWSEKIKEDESETLEFKSSFFTPILDEERIKKLEILKRIEKNTAQNTLEINKINGDLAKKTIIHSSLKTLVAFANHKGGTLLIGVDDNKNILGLEQEYGTFSKKDRNRDGFGKYFDGMIRNYIGDSFSSLMNRKFLKFPEGDILIVKIEPSNHEVFLLKNEEGKEDEQLYIRNLSSSKELKGSELAKYIRNKHLNKLYKNIEDNL